MQKRGRSLLEVKKDLLNNKDLAREYSRLDLAFEISKMIKQARMLKGLTQLELARLMETKQAGISRAENSHTLPSLSFLEKMAQVLGTYLIPPKFGINMEEDVKAVFRSKEIEAGQRCEVVYSSNSSFSFDCISEKGLN